MKQCTKCKQFKPLVEFSKCVTNFDGLQYRCKSCKNVIDQERRAKNPEKERQRSYQRYLDNKEKYDEYARKTNPLRKDYKKQWYLENLDKCKEYAKHRDKEQKKICDEKYRLKNKVTLAQKAKKRLLEEPVHKLIVTYRIRLNKIKKQIGKSATKMLPWLGCSAQEGVKYLEEKFYVHPTTGEQMTWQNHGLGFGKWQIDHIREFNQINIFEEKELKEVLHYTNLQPLWYEDHIEKTNNTRMEKKNGIAC